MLFLQEDLNRTDRSRSRDRSFRDAPLLSVSRRRRKTPVNGTATPAQTKENGTAPMLRIGIDTGGTFTDFVVVEGAEISVFKMPSTPQRPAEAVVAGLRRIKGEHRLIQHGTTVGTNALLERKGARTLLLTNQGFEDIIEIGRQDRQQLYSLSGSRPDPLVSPSYRIGVKERTSWSGRELIALEEKSLDWIRSKVEQIGPDSVAVVLLYSYLNPTPELRIAEALKPTSKPVSLSHRILPEFREFERTSATVINAYLSPVLSSYLSDLKSSEALEGKKLTLMQSSGGTISAERAIEEPVRTILSGPASGVVGAFGVARRAGFENAITFDMGGTSTDVCLCDGRIPTTREALIGGWPVPIQMIDIVSVGAGGGSIASVDSAGVLKVGPESAGAQPGPMCYGIGERVAVTDANLYLGLLDPDWFLGGDFPLQPDKAEAGLKGLAAQLTEGSETDWDPPAVARGIRSIVGAQMERAVRLASLAKGYDTRNFTLVSFGGAGGLHVCDLARSLLIPRIVMPLNPGTASALGTLQSDVRRDASVTILAISDDADIERRVLSTFEQLTQSILEDLEQEGFDREAIVVQRTVDVRYPGQSFELNVVYENDFRARFHEAHLQQYGYSSPELPVEIVTLRVSGRGQLPAVDFASQKLEGETPPFEALLQEKRIELEGTSGPTRFYVRQKLKPGNRIDGPAIVLEYSSTLLIPPDFSARVDRWSNLIIEPREVR